MALIKVKKDVEAEEQRVQIRLKAENLASENIARKEKTEKELIEFRLKKEMEMEAEKTKQRVLAGEGNGAVGGANAECA